MPQIFNNTSSIYDNLFYTYLWTRLSFTEKQYFLSEKENLGISEKGRFDAPEARREREKLCEVHKDNNPENVEKAMNMIDKNALTRFVTNNREELIAGAKRFAKSLLTDYITDVFKPPVSTSELYSILEKFPRKGNTVEHLPRFDKQTRRERRARSAEMRSILTDYVVWEKEGLEDYLKNGQKYPREYQLFFRPGDDDATKNHNYELSILFNSTNSKYENFNPNLTEEERNNNELWRKKSAILNSDEYKAWRKNRDAEERWVRETLIDKYTYEVIDGQKYRELKTKAVIDQEVKDYFRPENMRRRRGEIVMQNARESAQVLENLDALMAPGQTHEQLKENYFKIAKAQGVYMEMGKYVEAAEPGTGYLELSHKDRKWLDQQSDFGPNFTIAVCTMNMMANPLYEYVDPQRLNNFDMLQTSFYYDGLFGDRLDVPIENRGDAIFKKGNRTETQRRAMKKMDDYYKAHIRNAGDSLKCLCSDATVLQSNMTSAAQYASERMLEDYGLVRGATRRCCETYSNGSPDDYDFRQPVSYAMKDRVVIISSSDSAKDGFITEKYPERLYNHKIDNTVEAVGAAYSKANRWYTNDTNGYETIGLRFNLVLKEGKLPHGCKKKDLERIQKRYKALMNATAYYLERKGNHPKKGLETQRVEAVKKMQEFAQMKLNELDLVGKAMATLDKYKDKTREEIRSETARENATPKYAAHIKTEIPRAQAEGPVKWLKTQYTTLYAGGLSSHVTDRSDVSEYANDALRELERAKNPYENTAEMKETIIDMAGSLIVLEAIWQERTRLNTPGQPGPLESTYNKPRDTEEPINLKEPMQDYGKKAIQAVTGKEYDQLTSADLEKFLKEFDQRKYVREVNEKCGISTLEQKLTGRYVNSVTPERSEMLDAHEQKLQEFAKTNIMDPAKKYMSNPNAPVDPDDARKLMSSCVLHSMIQMERAGNHGKKPSLLESKLMNTEGVEELRQRIELSKSFRNMMETAAYDGVLRNRDIANLLEKNAPQKAAKESMEQVSARKRSNSISFGKAPAKNNELNPINPLVRHD